ncbi:MAG: type II secretion system protein, partial [Planctomycetota bacterium]
MPSFVDRSAHASPARPRHARRRHGGPGRARPRRRGLTLVEMLIAMAITLLMMAAVVTVFANVSDSVRNRRATIEMNSQVRHVREALQRDLAAATCPGL